MSEATSEAGTAGAIVGSAQEQERALSASDGTVQARIADGPLVAPVLRRLVSIVLARAEWPLDGLDDALLVCDALSAHAPAHTRAGRLAVSVRADEQEAHLRVGELRQGGAAALLADATLPVIGNVLEGIAASVSALEEPRGGSVLALVLRTRSEPGPALSSN